MYLYVELWKAKEAWRSLSEPERKTFVDGLGPAIASLTEAGVEILGFSFNDEDTEFRADYSYLAAWRMPSRDLALELERAVIEYGFHSYFEQVNARGEIVAPDAVLEDMQRGS